MCLCVEKMRNGLSFHSVQENVLENATFTTLKNNKTKQMRFSSIHLKE